MSSQSLQQPFPATQADAQQLVTRTGLNLSVRPAVAADEARMSDFFENVTPEDLRFRFLSAVQKVGHDQIAAMLAVDHDRNETFLAFDAESGQLVGVGTFAAGAGGKTAEVAVSVHRGWKGRGIGWSLLRYMAACARAKGISRLQSIESRDNHAAIELERDMGFTARAFPGDPTLMLVEADLADALA